jgi:hypothetical protein
VLLVLDHPSIGFVEVVVDHQVMYLKQELVVMPLTLMPKTTLVVAMALDLLIILILMVMHLQELMVPAVAVVVGMVLGQLMLVKVDPVLF